VDVPSLAVFKARLGGTLSNLVWWPPWQGGFLQDQRFSGVLEPRAENTKGELNKLIFSKQSQKLLK